MKKIIAIILVLHSYAHANSRETEHTREETVQIAATFVTAFRAFQTLPEAHRQPIVSGLIRGLSLADLASLREAQHGIVRIKPNLKQFYILH